MQCSKCGYVYGPFDTTCARCAYVTRRPVTTSIASPNITTRNLRKSRMGIAVLGSVLIVTLVGAGIFDLPRHEKNRQENTSAPSERLMPDGLRRSIPESPIRNASSAVTPSNPVVPHNSISADDDTERRLRADVDRYDQLANFHYERGRNVPMTYQGGSRAPHPWDDSLRYLEQRDQAQYELGQCLVRKGKVQEATACFRAVITSQGEGPEISRRAADTLKQLGQW